MRLSLYTNRNHLLSKYMGRKYAFFMISSMISPGGSAVVITEQAPPSFKPYYTYNNRGTTERHA
jgi:hypothetical protein